MAFPLRRLGSVRARAEPPFEAVAMEPIKGSRFLGKYSSFLSLRLAVSLS